MKYSLNGTWQLKGQSRINANEHVEIDAIVPGNVELDLYRHGIEKEPFYADNEFAYRKYEYFDWEFTRRFEMPKFDSEDEDVFLVFEGLNCKASIYLDNKFIWSSDNALTRNYVRLNADFINIEPQREYELKVKTESALLYAASLPYPVNISACEGSDEYTRLRMPAHSFGWDIMPRFPSAGMYRDVYIETKPVNRIDQTYFAAKHANESRANIVFKYRLKLKDLTFDAYRLRIYLDDELKIDSPIRFVSGEGNIYLDNPRLWWPCGYGSAETYQARTELVYNGRVIDSKTETIGVRKIEIVHKMAPNDEGEFLIKVNGCPILAKGSNWVPLDAFHSRDGLRRQRALELFRESKCNIMRLWGGNVYEDDELFEFCDKNGILVWHDFAFACAIYPEDDHFINQVKYEAEEIVRRFRNHPCILLWAGDNEIDETLCGREYLNGSNRYNKISREVLAAAVRQNDPFRLYLPSSPYIDFGIARYDVPEQHNWGARAYYKEDFYRLTRAHFISEFGYHGCPSAESLKRFIPENELNDMHSPSWECHSSEYTLLFKRGYNRNQLMRNQVKLMFGTDDVPLEAFSFLSQFTQAEALKFMIEQTRMKKWRRTGLIWWNMTDGWPEISDAVVDWYFTKKRAFNTIKRVQEPICVMISENKDWHHEIILGNDSRTSANVSVKIYDPDSRQTLFKGNFASNANSNMTIGSIYIMSSEQRLLIIEYSVDGALRKNHYLCGFPAFKIEDAQRWAKYIDEDE